VLKIAQSLDGKIAAWTGRSRWITGPAARRLGHRLRAQSDAVLVGAETVRRDNPALTSHGQGPDPLRVVLSCSLRLPLTARIFRPGVPTWVVASAGAPPARRRALEARGVPVLAVPPRGNGVDLAAALRALARRGVSQLMVEGGGRTAAAFLEAGLVDEVYCFTAPRFLGGAAAAPSVGGRGWRSPAEGPAFREAAVTRVGPDILVHGKF
jgi:diaminohydroxyphosphoribosylaminopyrimidine deaminase/5-amino-6-(5-phosphoribosylamino)uracil reductase